MKSIKITSLLFLLFSLCTAQAKDIYVTITNPLAHERHQLVDLSVDTISAKMNVKATSPLRVLNAAGLEQPCQLTYDGKLIFEVNIPPSEQMTYVIESKQPTTTRTWVYGKQYKIRKDDIAWENDRCGFRVYGPALQKTGERSFGIDVWTKNTPDLVLQHRYTDDYQGNLKEDSLQKAGKRDEAAVIDRHTSFHLDHGTGMDAYGVGPTLGCGTPAIMRHNKLIFPYCYHDFKILDNGPLRFTLLLNFAPNADGVIEHRLISLDKATHFNRMTVWYDQFNTPETLGTGLVLRGENKLKIDKDFIAYADPTDNQKAWGSTIFVGLLYPNGVDETGKFETINHALGLKKNYHGEPFTYYFGSAWSAYDMPTFAHWTLECQESLDNLKHPLILTIR